VKKFQQELLQYIKRVRKALPETIPVGYVDAYYQFLDRPAFDRFLRCDFSKLLSFLGGADSPYALSYIDKMVELTQKKLQREKVLLLKLVGQV
jgi:GPH family glycoside/pentoside/hexuronide:cation symporter